MKRYAQVQWLLTAGVFIALYYFLPVLIFGGPE